MGSKDIEALKEKLKVMQERGEITEQELRVLCEGLDKWYYDMYEDNLGFSGGV